MYDPSLGGAQVDDFNPGIQPSGLFWTTRLPADAVQVNPGAGRATYAAKDVAVYDYGDFNTALSGADGTPARVSFEVRWTGVQQRLRIDDPAADFAGEFVRGSAQMAWSATVGHYEFQSAPIDQSRSDLAEIGTERNGVFNDGSQ